MNTSIIADNHFFVTTGGRSLPFVAPNSNNPITGMIRINGDALEVFDGQAWSPVPSSTITLGLADHAHSAIEWALRKMKEEEEWQKLARDNQAVKIAIDNLNAARQQLDITAKLARNYEQTS